MFRDQNENYENPIYINANDGTNNLNMDFKELTELSSQTLKANIITNYQTQEIEFKNDTHDFDIFTLTD